MRNKNKEVKSQFWFLTIGIVILGMFIWFYSGCDLKKEIVLEDKTLHSSSDLEVITVHERKKISKDKEEKDHHKFDQNYFITLEPKFAEEGGRVNPFIPLTSEEAGGAVVRGISTPTVPSSSLQVPTPIPTQLPPLPQQKGKEVSLPEIPEWPRESPILAAGPPQKLENLLNLKVTGIVYSQDGKKRYAIIEEIASYKSSYQQQQTSFQRIKSYVVRKGDFITEYRLRVKDIKKNVVILTRGNQKIELPLLYTPQPYALPYESQIPASEARYKWKAEESGG